MTIWRQLKNVCTIKKWMQDYSCWERAMIICDWHPHFDVFGHDCKWTKGEASIEGCNVDMWRRLGQVPK